MICRTTGRRERSPIQIVQKIIDKKADYVLALKGNQGTLRDDVELFAREQKAVAFKNTSVSQDTTVDGGHGRIETRTVTVFHDIDWLQDNHQWPGLRSVVMVESERETDGKVETETRFRPGGAGSCTAGGFGLRRRLHEERQSRTLRRGSWGP